MTTNTYQPQYRLHGGATWTSYGNPVAAKTVTVTGLQPSTSYDFQVTRRTATAP